MIEVFSIQIKREVIIIFIRPFFNLRTDFKSVHLDEGQRIASLILRLNEFPNNNLRKHRWALPPKMTGDYLSTGSLMSQTLAVSFAQNFNINMERISTRSS